MKSLHRKDGLPWSHHTLKAPKNCVAKDGHYPRTSNIDEFDQAQIVLKPAQPIQKLRSNFRAYRCTINLETMQRPTINLRNNHWEGDELLEHAKKCAYLTSRPCPSKLNWLHETRHQRLRCPSAMCSPSTTTGKDDEINRILVKVSNRLRA